MGKLTAQVEVPDGESICPDPDERTTGVFSGLLPDFGGIKGEG